LKAGQLNWRRSILVRNPRLRDFRSSRQCWYYAVSARK